uniref:pentapeptide repeat-containing protein n=1 Tax=Rothia mucilaginosa TaxID=43675 RepID=UPI0028E81869
AFGGNAGFCRASFGGNASFFRTDFAGTAEFREAVFEGYAGFSTAAFGGDANFSGVVFERLAWFSEATFEAGAEFTGASFMGVADFCDVSFVKTPPGFVAEDADSGEMCRARFAALSAGSEATGQEAHNFTVYEGNQPILLGTAMLLNRTFILPIGAVLYDPNSWDEEKQEYTRLSEPAK